MAVTDKSGNGVVSNVGGATRPGWSLWNATADGDGTPVPWPGGPGTIVVAGTMGGGTIKIKTSFVGKAPDTKLTVDNSDQLNITAVGTYDFRFMPCDITPSLSGSSGASVSVGVGGYDL